MKNLFKFNNKLSALLKRYGFAFTLLFAGLLITSDIFAYTINQNVYIYGKEVYDCGGNNLYMYIYGDGNTLKNEACTYEGDYLYKWTKDADRSNISKFFFYKSDATYDNPTDYAGHKFAPATKCQQGYNTTGFYTDVNSSKKCWYVHENRWSYLPDQSFYQDIYFYDNNSFVGSGKKMCIYFFAAGTGQKYEMTSLGNNLYKYEIDKTNGYKQVTYITFYTSDAVDGEWTKNSGENRHSIPSTNYANICCYYPAHLESETGWGIAPMYNPSLILTSTQYGGDGTSATPYIVYSGDKVQVENNSSVPNSSQVGKQCKWKSTGAWTVYKTGVTDEFSIDAGASVTAESVGRLEYDSKYSAELTAPNLYVKATAYKRTADAYYQQSPGSATYVAGATGGTVQIKGSAQEGAATAEEIKIWSTSTTFVAAPASGYSFLGWYTTSTPTGSPVSTNLEYTETFDSENPTVKDRHIYALFENNAEVPVVLIADTATISDGPKATLSGYLKYYGCLPDVTEYGFYGCKGDDCTPSSAMKWTSSSSVPIKTGAVFTAVASELDENSTYRYQAYVHTGGDLTYISDETGTFKTRKGCEYPDGDTIYVTIDNTLASNDRCALKYKSFTEALAELQTSDRHPAWLSSNFLTKNVVFLVEYGTGSYGTDGNTYGVDLSNINKWTEKDGTAPTYRLVVRSADQNKRPLLYGVDLKLSRWITLDKLYIKRTKGGDGADGSAIRMGDCAYNNGAAVGRFDYAGLVIKNCTIDFSGFCGIHADDCDGITFYKNEFIATASSHTDNDKYWGAQLKFMNVMNVSMVGNSFKGQHATNIFIQGSQKMLLMNNVFWNDNKFNDNVAFIRLLAFAAADHPLQNIGVYYNTFYLDSDPDGATAHKVDFFKYGARATNSSRQDGNQGEYKYATIEFMNNNCYSYSQLVNGRNKYVNETANNTFLDVSEALMCDYIKDNNYWSVYDDNNKSEESVFSMGCSGSFIDVSEEVCFTTASDPDNLIVKGSTMNKGLKLTSDISGQGATLIEDDYTGDERPAGEVGSEWTYGAYQTKQTTEESVIIWNGKVSSDWDNRNNWITEDGTPLSCVNNLQPNLKIIIPAPLSENYKVPAGGIVRYPILPGWSDDSRTTKYGDEKVQIAGDKFTATIEIEHGGAIKGVEKLTDKDAVRYTEAVSHLKADRKQWILVGTVTKPFTSGEKSATRNIKSGDYYLNHMPHVYMQQFTENGGEVKYGTPFTSLEEEVNANTSFAIFVADQYGASKLPAAYYYALIEKNPAKVGDGTVPRVYDFNGRFANDAALPSYTLTSGYNFLNNSYPAALNATELEKILSGDAIKVFDYNNMDFVDLKNAPANYKFIRPQTGFIIVTSSAKTINLTSEMFDETKGSTYKSATIDAGVSIRAYNTATGTGSTIGVWSDYKNIEKAFNGSNADNAELYIIGDNNVKYSTVTVDNMKQIIPLGIRNKTASKYAVKFEVTNSESVESVILEDRSVDPVKTYDILEGETAYISGIVPGDNEGRLFLNINYADEDVPTGVDDASASSDIAPIFITAKDDVVTVSAPQGEKIMKVIVTDMSGKTQEYAPTGDNLSRHKIPAATGVYIVNVITDIRTAQQKVLIKD